MNRKRGHALIVTLVVAGCGAPQVRPVGVGDHAPDYMALTAQGDIVSLDEFASQPVLLNVWTARSGLCREEVPAFEALYRAYVQQGLRVIGVSIDGPDLNRAIKTFLADMDVTYVMLHDPAAIVSESFGLMSVPSTVLIDRHGVIAHRWIGPFDPLAEETQAIIRKVLDDSSAHTGPRVHKTTWRL
jgi:peroxiredoxin